MDTLETTDYQESCHVNSGHPNGAQAVSPRRLKKREVDRRCQREARERKRSRIAYLEGLVVDLRQRDESGQVTALLKQLKRVEEERDMVTKTLKDIQQLMVQRPLSLGKDRAQDNGIAEVQVISEHAKNRSESTRSTSGQYTPAPVHTQLTLPIIGTTPANISKTASFVTIAPNGKLSAYPACSSSEMGQHSSSIFADQALGQSNSARRQHTTGSSGTYDWVNPQSSCCCHVHVDRQPGQRAVWQGNFWKFVCDVLSERFDWPEDAQPADDVQSEDLPIRAMLEGWDSVAKRGPLHPSWQMLRRIDEATFRPIPKTERLAMLRAMHLLLQFHTQPSAERYKRLPPWYLYRPSHHIPHTYAMDYYAWPPFRQRFISNQDAYCGNDFWYMYQSQLRLLWPFEFRDCYTHDLETGLYSTSRLFDERINDIKCWTMGFDFFQRFPELSSDIPVGVGRVPKPLTSEKRQVARRSRLHTSTASNKGLSSTRMTVVDEGEQQEQEQAQAQQHDEWPDFPSAASSQTVPTPAVQSQPHLTQSHNEQAHALPLFLHGYEFQQPASGPAFSSSSSEWHDFLGVDFNPSFMEITTDDASAFPFMPGGGICVEETGPTDRTGFYNTF